MGCNLFEWGTFLRRIDNFLTDLYLDPVNVNNSWMHLWKGIWTSWKRCADQLEIQWILIFGDDLGTNTGPFMPPEIYTSFFEPRHKFAWIM
jgi:uroporphyrinogen decarboxylase